MKLLPGYLLLITVTSLFAESTFERELSQLNAQRSQAAAAATAPIERRYKEALEALLRRATQANDLDSAIKIRQAMGEPPDSAPASDPAKVALTKRGLENRLEKTKWEALTVDWLMKMSFQKGKIIHNPNAKGEGRSAAIQAIDGSTVVYTWDAGEKITITFSPDLSTCERGRTKYKRVE